jgi:hypothetical protein
MTTDYPVTVDVLRELRAREEREQVAVVTAMTALMQQQQQILLAAVALGEGQSRPVVVRRR